MKRIAIEFSAFAMSILLCVATFITDSFAVPASPPGRLLIFDENPFNGTARGFYWYKFDTQELHLVSEVPMAASRFEGMEWNPNDGLVYAGSSTGNLYTIDHTDGTVNLVGNIPSNSGLSSTFIRGIAFKPNANQVYGFGFGPKVYQIDPQTAVGSLVGVSPDLDAGLAFSPDGRLWGLSDQRKLLEINPATALTVQTFSSTIVPLSNVTISPDGRMFGTMWQDGRIVEIDLQTGVPTTIKSFGDHTNGFMGAVWVVPEPSTFSIASLLVVFVVCRRATR